MKKVFILSVLWFSAQILYAEPPQNDTYQFFVNLNKATVKGFGVELITPKINSDKTLYRFPAMVPGTYSVYNFGRFIHNLKAFDASGNELSTSKTDTNSWQIDNASSLYKITYSIEPTFTSKQTNAVFEPVGTNVQPDTNYVINNHAIFGYFSEQIDNTYVLHFSKPKGFYGATSLNATERTESDETFTSAGYHYLVDNPIMFCRPDTASVNFDEASIMISVYSPGKVLDAVSISSNMKSLLTAIRSYLGGKLPTDKYTFLFYFADRTGVSGANGALEHNQSSMYYLTDVPASYKDYMLKQLVSTCAHEFMHIVTPLTLHSVEIGKFDFNNPVMSEHLWLYEGETEYSAYYIQLRENMMSLTGYLDAMNRKIKGASRFNDTLPFTEMSKGALDKYKRQYQNVYEKGALIGLCLDVLIRKESGGQQGLKDVIAKLQEKYGKDRPFNDDDLFADFTTLTSPAIGEFFNHYVAGPEKLPFKEILGYIGLDYQTVSYETVDFGAVKLGFNRETRHLQIQEVDETNDFIKALGVKAGDDLIAVNGKDINFFNVQEAFGSSRKPIKTGDTLSIEVARKDEKGKTSNVNLSAIVTKTKTAYDSKIVEIQAPDDSQLALRKAWMGR